MNLLKDLKWSLPTESIECLKLNPLEMQWLCSQESLTNRLRHLGTLNIKIHGEYWLNDTWNRKVSLCLNQKPWIYAESYLTETILKLLPRPITQLGTEPLGDIIYNSDKIQPSTLTVSCIQKSHSMYKALNQFNDQAPERYWARKRLFQCGHITWPTIEVFLAWEQMTLNSPK